MNDKYFSKKLKKSFNGVLIFLLVKNTHARVPIQEKQNGWHGKVQKKW